MAVKAPRLQPATKEKACQICGTTYTYPEPGSTATRHYCELCEGLPETARKVMHRLAKRVAALERQVKKLSAS